MSLLKKIAIPALLVLSLAQTGVLVKQALDDKKLGENKYADVSKDSPVCLAEKGSPSAFILLEADEEAKVYRGVKVVLIMPVPFEKSFRELNSRQDLIQVNCENGQPLGE